MKRISLIVTLAFLIAGGSLWISQNYLAHWEPHLRQQLERRLGTALKARVHIDHISISFLHRVSLQDISVWDTQSSPEKLIFRAKEVTLTASLIDLPRAFYHRNPLEVIGLITVDTPFIMASPELIRQRSGKSAGKMQATPLWFALEWTHGTFQWKDDQSPPRPWTLYGANGYFRIRGPHIDALARGSIDHARGINLRLRTLGRRWSAHGRLFAGEVPYAVHWAERLTKRSLLPPNSTTEGRFDLDLKSSGRWPLAGPLNWPSLIHEARLHLSNVRLNLPASPPVQLNGDLVLDDGRVKTSGLTLQAEKNVFKITGYALPFAHPPEIDLEANDSQMDLTSLSPFLIRNSSHTPFLRGIGSGSLSVKGPALQPDISIRATIPQGEAGRWPFQNAVFQLHRHEKTWEIVASTVQLWGGILTLKGRSTAEETDLQLTGKEMSLEAIPSSRTNAIKGRLNFAVNTRGPSDALRTTGSFWINNASWVKTPIDSVRGGLDITPAHFELHGGSEDESIRLQLEGTRTAKGITLQQGLFQLRPHTVLNSQGTYTLTDKKIHLAIDAKNISLSEDIPITSAQLPPFHGEAHAQATFDGLLPQFILKADIQSSNFQWGSSKPTETKATLRWTAEEFRVESFRMEPGVAGSGRIAATSPATWNFKLALANAPVGLFAALFGRDTTTQGKVSGDLEFSNIKALQGSGTLSLDNATFGALSISRGIFNFTFLDRTLDIKRFSFNSPEGQLDLKGRASWERPLAKKVVEKVIYSAEGKITSPKEGSLWNAAYRVRGEIDPQNKWKGFLHIDAPTVSVYNKPSEPFETDLHWTGDALLWTSMRWGKSLLSSGSVRFKDAVRSISGEFKAQDLDMARWQALFWPQGKEPVRGLLTGGFLLGGSTDNPLIQFSATVKNGTWRAFHFETGAEGTWKKTGLEPLTLDGKLLTGGQFHFQGRVSSIDQTASGSLDLTQFELKPIGQSLAFPHLLESKTSGTLTVSGPLNHLRFAGHIDGGELVYGSDTPRPFRLQSYVVDLKLEPFAGTPETTRLTVTQALVKTKEEEIRISPGSFVDFSKNQEARVQMGTEIRNLHLGVFTLFGGLDINGTWKIQPQGFALQGQIFTRSLYINDYQLEQGYVEASYYNRVLSFQPPRNSPPLITGTIDFQNAPQLNFKNFAVMGRERENLRLTGEFGPKHWDFAMEGTGLDLSTLGGLAGFPYSLNGSANVKIRGAGDLEHPHVEGTLDVQDGRALGLSFRNGTAAFAWQGQRMTFTRLQLSDPGRYNLTGAGVFPLGAKTKNAPFDKTIDFSIRLTDSNLGLLQSITSEVKSAKGAVQALLQIKGTTDDPTWQGSIRVKNGYIDGAHYFKRIRDFQFAADFDGNELVLSDLRGTSGKGEFTGGGHVTFAGFEPKFYDLRLEVPAASKSIEVTVPELAIPESPLAKKFKFLTLASQADVRGKVTFRGPAEAPVFFGQASISNGHFTFPPSSKNPPPAAFTEWVRRILWDIDLRFSDDAWFENELVEANLVGGLTIKGPKDKLRVDGGMDITEGKISYLGVEFDIRQARFDIRSTDTGSAIVTTPYVRGVAESHVQTVDVISGQGVNDTITLTLNYAAINEIKPQLRSSLDPNLTQDKVLNRVTQLEVQNLNPQERSYLYQQQMVRLLDTSLATPLARSLLKRTGLVDELHVSRIINPAAVPLTTDPNNPSAGQQDAAVNFLAGTKYTVAKNLSSRLSLGYGLRFEQITNADLTNKLDLRSDVEMSYRFVSNIYLRGTFDLPSQTAGSLPDRKVTIEPHWRFGWWGNTNKPKPKLPKAAASNVNISSGTKPFPSASQ